MNKIVKNHGINPIMIWRFQDAPKEYKELSENGGDEDWLAFIPDSMVNYDPMFLDEGTSFGCCSVDEYRVIGGKVRIGAHA